MAIAAIYGLAMIAGGVREARRTGSRVFLGLGLGLGGLSGLGAAVLATGDPAGRGLALAAGSLGLVISGWIVSRHLLDGRPLGRVVLVAGLSLAQVLGVRFGDVAVAATAPPEGLPMDRDGIEEASGVVRRGDELLFVGDGAPGVYFSCPVPAAGPRGLPLRPADLRRHPMASSVYGIDLESIGVLADRRVVVLSERLGALLDETGLVASYDRSLDEVGGRGLEGLAVRDLGGGRSRIAVLWEGGYPETGQLPASARTELAGRAMRPVILVHDLEPGETLREIGRDEAERWIELDPPRPPGREPWAQRYRAPDLVWYRGERNGRREWGFVVLLSSMWSTEPGPAERDCECPKRTGDVPLKYCWKKLQRFDLAGIPWGEPFDLDPAFPEEIRTVNWEGLAWFEEGRSVVLVYDEPADRKRIDPQVAVVVPLPGDW